MFRLIWNQTDVRLLFQINREIVNTIWFRFDFIRFRKYFLRKNIFRAIIILFFSKIVKVIDCWFLSNLKKYNRSHRLPFDYELNWIQNFEKIQLKIFSQFFFNSLRIFWNVCKSEIEWNRNETTFFVDFFSSKDSKKLKIKFL